MNKVNNVHWPLVFTACLLNMGGAESYIHPTGLGTCCTTQRGLLSKGGSNRFERQLGFMVCA